VERASHKDRHLKKYFSCVLPADGALNTNR